MHSLLSAIVLESPFVLWGLLFVSVPIIVHLFNLRKAKKIEFSNVSLLKKVKEESTSKKRPIELLILLMRIIAIIMLVFAFARPVQKENTTGQSSSDEVLLYLDNSISMSESTGTGTLYDNAYDVVTGIINSYPEGTNFKLLENSYALYSSFGLTQSAVEKQLNSLNQVGVDRDAEELVSKVVSNNFVGDSYWVSDFNASGDLNAISADSTSNYYLIPLSASESVNIYIDSTFLENTFYSGQFSNNIVIELAATQKISRSVNLRISIDNQLLGTSQVAFNNTSAVNYRYQIPNEINDLSRLQVTIEGADSDYDNTFYLSINQLEPVNILEIYAQGSSDFIASLYQDNELFEFNRTSINTLQNSAFERADVIILNEIPSFSNQFYNSIRSFLERNGSLVIIPNTRMDLQDMRPLGLNVRPDDNQRQALEPIDFNNPFFEGIFEEQEDNIQMPNASTQWRLLNSEYALLRFKNSRPFLAKVASERNIYFLSSSLGEDYSSFANHAIFVPVMYKLALGAQSNANRLYYYTDDEILSFPLKEQGGNNIYKLISEEAELIPDQRIVNGQLILEIPKDQISIGQYQLATDSDTLGYMSFNLPKSESVSNPLRSESLLALSQFDHVEILEVNSREQVERFIGTSLNGIALWKFFLLAALFFLFAEIILIRYL